MTRDLSEETLSSSSMKVLVKEKVLNFHCDRYFQEEFSILSSGLHNLQSDELILNCVDPLLENLRHLICSNDLDLPASPKIQIAAFMEKLGSLRNFIKIARTELDEVQISVQSWWWESRDLLTSIKKLIETAIFLSYNSWARPIKERIEELFFSLVIKIKHLEPEIRMSYAQFLRTSANPGSQGIDLQALASVDSMLDNLQKLLKDQDAGSIMQLDVPQIVSLHQEMSFLKYFLIDPYLEQYAETLPESLTSLLIPVEDMARRASFPRSACGEQTKDQMADEVNLMHFNMLKIVNRLKVEIREMYQRVPKPSMSCYPQTPKLAFLCFFLHCLEELQKNAADSIAYVKNEIEIVRSELGFLSSFVSDTTKNLEEDGHIAKRVVDVAYEAEHVIDLISASNLPSWYYMLWLSDVIGKIKTLRKDCTEVCNKKTCDVSVLNMEKVSISDPPHAYALAAEEEFVGFRDEAEKIIDLLTIGSEKLQIVSIVGMPGLGKTTLAKKVYEHPSVSSYFHVRSWYCISQVYDRRDLLLSILGNLIGLTEEICKMNDESMAEVLYRSLKGRRYLIVLDDIWSIKPWNDIRSSFPDDCKGSRILFTSRIREVALKANPTNAPHDLRLFSDEESWELLKKKVFHRRNCPPKLCTIGKQIAKNCKGLPLSVVVIAGILMKTKETKDHWIQISESLGKQVGDSRECADVLELSYKHLPDHLKPCFLYLGAFREDKEIPTRKLICLWLAEGFVPKTKSENLENVAEGYLMDLIARRLVLIAQKKSNGGVKSCRLHDLWHEFSLNKAKDEKFLLMSEEIGTVPQQYRHGSYCKKFSFHGWMPGEPYLRSILFLPTYREYHFFYDFSVLPYILKLLRVLDLEHIHLNSCRFPTAIEQLVHLRYLAIHGRLKYVPPSVANLWRLETFIIKLTINDVVRLPEIIFEMPHLKHVCINKLAFEFSDTFQLEKYFESCAIEKLSRPALCHGNTTEKLIRRLGSLRKLKCIFLISRDKRFPVLDMLSKLESLNVTYQQIRTVHHCEFSFPPNLKKLTLSGFHLPWSDVSKIGQRLPQLKVLKLLSGSFLGRRWDASDDEFRNLKFLKLEGLNIVEWDASPDAFPCLERLVLERCTNLEEIPSSFEELDTLRMIEVKWCSYSAIEAARKIKEEQQDQGNDGFKLLIQSINWDYKLDHGQQRAIHG